jgi:hypothetical protein
MAIVGGAAGTAARQAGHVVSFSLTLFTLVSVIFLFKSSVQFGSLLFLSLFARTFQNFGQICLLRVFAYFYCLHCLNMPSFCYLFSSFGHRESAQGPLATNMGESYCELIFFFPFSREELLELVVILIGL